MRNNEVKIKDIGKLNPKKIILSPGPSTPNEAGICLEVVRNFGGQLPILGVCLGHQVIAAANGAKVIEAKKLMHGKTSTIKIVKKSALFKSLPSKFTVARYHSLVIDNINSEKIKVTSRSLDDDEIMSFEVKNETTFGIQFHPESIASEHGKEILNNFLKL